MLQQLLTVVCKQVAKEDLRKLFVHGVPQTAESSDLLQLFEACPCARPAVEGELQERKGTECIRPDFEIIYESVG